MGRERPNAARRRRRKERQAMLNTRAATIAGVDVGTIEAVIRGRYEPQSSRLIDESHTPTIVLNMVPP